MQSKEQVLEGMMSMPSENPNRREGTGPYIQTAVLFSCDFFKVLISSPVFVNFDKFSYGSVISPFHIVGKETGRKLFHIPVVLDAFAADAFAAARLPGAVALLHVFFAVAFFHSKLRQCSEYC
jgi:hypothetical protein